MKYGKVNGGRREGWKVKDRPKDKDEVNETESLRKRE